MSPEVDRRNHTRYALPSMYSTVTVLNDDGSFKCGGHAYDISEGGMRFELLDALEPGSTVDVRIDLPGGGERAVTATCNILWVEEEDLELPGPVRMACSFAHIENPSKLAALLKRGRYHMAA